ncbi:MAG: hypothetical protein H7Y61_01580 [Rhizobiales bacterium]|nr:hypothetical protein [Rhizobacter sp.]
MTTAAALFHIAFYRFVRLNEPARVAEALRELTRDLLGAVLVAGEGINGTLAGESAVLDRFEHALQTDPRFGGAFQGIAFRRSACVTPPYQRIKVHVRGEVLPLGVKSVDAVGRRGVQLDPAQWRDVLDADDTVVIDNRNSFEFRLGRFRDAIDPQVGNFRDLPVFIAKNADDWKARGQRVAMYCTGGIRCEKTAAWMHDAFGLEVLQLGGGILRYFAEAPDAAADWQGECFVFDNRIALDVRLRETATTAAEVYAGRGDNDSDEAWRLQRAQRLAGS